MTILSFVVQLMGATMLLLYAVRMVRTGIERAFGASFRRIVTTTSSPISSASTGLVLAIVLQSSAAVGLLVAGFAGSGALGFGAGLSVVLGADLGSALLIQVLSFKLEWLVPLLLAVGGGLFIKSDGRKLKQAGRIILGIAFILISLRFLRETMDPIRDSAFLPSIAGFLERDFVTAFIVGALLAWVMHSSVAVILMCVTLVAIDAIPVAAGVSLVLGANLGSAIIPIWLTRSMTPVARRVPLANFLLRGSGAIAALILVNKLTILPYLSGMGEAQTLINAHLLFNAMLLLALPFCGLLERPMKRFLPMAEITHEDMPQMHRSVLDEASLKTPQLALANLKREVLRMSQVVEGMTAPTIEFYESYDKTKADDLIARDAIVNTALDDIRRFVADIPMQDATKQQKKRARELTEYAIALESVGDLVVKLILPLAREKSQKGIEFSKAGQEELIGIHERMMANMGLASNVLVSDDLDSARLLLEEKAEMTRLERSSRKKHLKRLTEGTQTSFDSSDIHLEVLRGFREINSHIASVSYPILYRGGQLLETRLIETMTEDEDERLSS
ncbi:Na/Pi cotransporter family protein [uncultured Roseovarius sp.]|uniref:Na/Pi cotransporter family protein n=1 Tax=uncultured Roseovarius sp. TaxID=293344 RepID=UPI00262A3469|nr:Na/Pi cotransporter family protein [uncultured Roseovarius sp.]